MFEYYFKVEECKPLDSFTRTLNNAMIVIFIIYFDTYHIHLKIYPTLNLEVNLNFACGFNFDFSIFFAFPTLLVLISYEMHYKLSQKIKFRAKIKFLETQ